MSAPKQTPIYGNWKMFSPSGDLMCRMDDKRANWYLKRDLAEIIEEQTIRLKFQPRGNGNHGVAAMVEEKANRCVVCGSEHLLNRHHIVPYQYRKHFPLTQKARTSYDVVPLCLECHEAYEIVAQKFSIELGELYGVPQNQARDLFDWEIELVRALKAASTLVKKNGQLPLGRIFELEAFVKSYFYRTEMMDLYELEEFLKTPHPKKPSPSENHGSLMVAAVLERDELQKFIVMWREHFVETMAPQFLSSNWTTDFILPR